jgi:hypothetical protein
MVMTSIGRGWLPVAVAALLWASWPAAGLGQGKHEGAGDRKRPNDAADEGIETENLFGFTNGSDTGKAGSKELGVEAVLASGKRAGSYRALGTKLEWGFGITDDLSMSFSALGDCHRIRNIPELDDIHGRCGINGVGAEVRWRLLNRKTAPFGLTLHAEPSFARFDESSGQVGRKIGSENKIILDQELIPGTLFGAVNLLYDPERFRERLVIPAERGSVAGIAAALAYRVSKTTFVGGEVRYLRAYDGLALNRFSGQALYAGPTLFTQLTEKAWLSAAWNIQVAGREALDRRELAAGIVEALEAGEDPLFAAPARRSRLDLKNFERHQFKLKAGLEF